MPVLAEARSMPSHDGLWANNDKLILPARPESREHDPERTIELGNPRPRPIVSLNRELLAQRKLDDRLFLVASEEGNGAVKEQHCRTDQDAHGKLDTARYFGPERV